MFPNGPELAAAVFASASNDMQRAALTYVGLGLPVFPLWPVRRDGSCGCSGRFGHCPGAGKHPATRWRKGEPEELPTLDPVQVDRWWGAGHRSGYPRATFGIGIPTGVASGLFVVDVDNKDGKGGSQVLAELEAQHGALPSGPRVLTPTGGEHLGFKDPGRDYGSTVEAVGRGIDTRGEGGFVVVPHSLHRNGGRYEFDQARRLTMFRETGLPEVPAWLLERCRGGPRLVEPHAQPSAPAATWPVPHAEALATLVGVLDSALARWLVEHPDQVSREPWRAFATNLHAAAAGVTDRPK